MIREQFIIWVKLAWGARVCAACVDYYKSLGEEASISEPDLLAEGIRRALGEVHHVENFPAEYERQMLFPLFQEWCKEQQDMMKQVYVQFREGMRMANGELITSAKCDKLTELFNQAIWQLPSPNRMAYVTPNILGNHTNRLKVTVLPTLTIALFMPDEDILNMAETPTTEEPALSA